MGQTHVARSTAGQVAQGRDTDATKSKRASVSGRYKTVITSGCLKHSNFLNHLPETEAAQLV